MKAARRLRMRGRGRPKRSFPPAGLLPLPYVGYEELGNRPHVLVDGATRPSSVLTLSHWPQSPTPPVLARDLSTEMALAFVRCARGERGTSGGRDLAGALAAAGQAEAVTNDHFDEDGLMSVVALVAPELALDHEEVLVGAAACGDFGVVRSDEAAKISFAVAPLAEAEAGPGAGPSQLYAAVLDRVPNLIERPERYERYWHDEMEDLLAGRSAVERGEVVIAEEPEVDLAVVRRVSTGTARGAGRPAGRTREGDETDEEVSRALPVHAAAVNSTTSASRVLAFDGQRCELYLRYESWVRVVSRKVPLRPHLEPLAVELTALEPGPVRWEADPVGAIVPRLRPSGEGASELAPEVILERVRSYLAAALPAWDPFGAAGPYVRQLPDG